MKVVSQLITITGLSRPIGPNEPGDRTLTDLERTPAQRSEAIEAFHYSLNPKHT